MVNCAVYSCKMRSATSNLRDHGVSYHQFPRDPVIREKWRIFCRNTEKWTPTRTSAICSKHFNSSSFKQVNNNRRQLIEGAIPTLNDILDTNAEIAKLPKSANNTIIENTPATATVVVSFSSPSPSIPSTTTTSVSKLVESQIKLRQKLQVKNRKIRILQAKTRYLTERVNTLQDLLENLEKRSLTGKLLLGKIKIRR